MGSSSAKLASDKPVVVIVGGGYAGVEIARRLDDTNKFNVVLIDRKNYFLHNVAGLRAAVDKDFAKNVLIPYSSLLKNNGVFLRGTVSRIDSYYVTVHNHPSPIPFDYLVICTGSSYAFPGKVNDADISGALNRYHSIAGHIERASKIVVVGGGAVGVEFAAEIAVKYNNKNHNQNKKEITLIHSHNNLVRDDFKPEFHTKVREKLESKNIKLILGERVLVDQGVFPSIINSDSYFHSGNANITTNKGTQVEADLILMATGTKVNTSAFRDTFSRSLNEFGRLRTNDHLQVDGYNNIFAAGDCQGQENKMAYFAKLQGEVVAKNILKLHSKKPALEVYKSIPLPVTILSIGNADGVSQFPTESGTVVGGNITSFLKSKHLMVPDTWKSLRMAPPKSDVEVAKVDVQQGNKSFRSKKEALAHALHISQEKAEQLVLSGLVPKPIQAGQDSL